MNFPRVNKQLIGFDDRKFFWLGVIISTLIIPFLNKLPLSYIWSRPVGVFFETSLFVFTYFITYRSLVLWTRTKMPRPEDVWKRLGFILILSVIITPGVSIVLGRALDFFRLCFQLQADKEPSFGQTIIITYLLSTAVIAIYEAAYYFKKYMDSQLEKEKLESMHTELRLHNLRNQINPHFLFNSLNILMGLIASDSEAAMQYLGKLSKFYRYAVGHQEEQLVELKEELENAKLFSELLKVRFEDNLEFIWPEDLNYPDKMIVPLSLQLLIENAVKHNIVSKSKPLVINISIVNNAMVISNNLQEKISPVDSTGMGLENIKERFSYFSDDPVRIEKTAIHFNVHLPLI